MARGDQQTRQTKGEESQSSVTNESGEQSQFEPNENHRSKGQMGESQSHHQLWSCGAISCLKECSHVSNSSAKHRQRDLWQRMVNKSETWMIRHSIQDTRGNSKMHNTQKCECCQNFHFNAESCPSWKHCRAG